jgi:phosphate uptake regulator
MKRKVAQIGPCTLMVSLPAKWAKTNNIKKGDEVDIIEENQLLKISVNESKPVLRKKILDTSNIEKNITRYLAAIYRKGYDSVEIRFKEPGFIKEIQKSLRFFIGFEIVEHGDHYCRIKKISAGVEGEFDSILKRTFLLLLSSSEDSLKIIKKGEFSSLIDMYHLEETNNTFTTFCRRLLLKQNNNINYVVPILYYIIEQLEKIADEYKYICDCLMGFKKNEKLSANMINIYSLVNDLLRSFYHYFYKYDIKDSFKISIKSKEIIKKSYQLFEKCPKKEIRTLHHLINITMIIKNISTVYLVDKM